MPTNRVVFAGVIVSGVLATSTFALAAPPPAQCIGKHCAIVAPAVAPAAPPIVAETGLGPAHVTHPAVGVYCVQPSVAAVAPKVYVPVVSVDAALSVAAPPASLAEVNFPANRCPKPPVVPVPFLEVDTFAIFPGAAAPVSAPSDTVGFNIEF